MTSPTAKITYNFDQVIARRGTDSVKWKKYGDDIIPMWVADMEFFSAEPVNQALHERVDHGIFGYGLLMIENGKKCIERLKRFFLMSFLSSQSPIIGTSCLTNRMLRTSIFLHPCALRIRLSLMRRGWTSRTEESDPHVSTLSYFGVREHGA